MKEDEYIFSLAGIAAEIGVSRSTFKRRLKQFNIVLPHWRKGRTSCSYVPRAQIHILKTRVLGSD